MNKVTVKITGVFDACEYAVAEILNIDFDQNSYRFDSLSQNDLGDSKVEYLVGFESPDKQAFANVVLDYLHKMHPSVEATASVM